MDIRSKAGYPAENLSNFTRHEFTMDGVACASMEGFLQSLKFQDIKKQLEICQLWGGNAKKNGAKKNKRWKSTQTLYWKGVEMDRHGELYQQLLDRAFFALATNEAFKKALNDTGNEPLTHSFGCDDPNDTVLTEKEFCQRLMMIRENVRNEV